jgi:DUF4097 and DUF4098 domain-containing protein YvlB
VEVQAHEVAYAGSDGDARKIFDAEAAHLKVSGNAVLITSESNDRGRVNLTVTVPKTARVTVSAGKGDVAAAGLGAGLNVRTTHGDTHLNSITGNVEVHLSNSKQDFSAHQVDGDLTADGDCNDLTLSEIKGRVSMNGQIFGEAHVENVTGPVSVHTSVTDVQIAELPGDLTFDSDNLRVSESKDVDLSQVYGDSYVEDHDGRISVEPAGAYNVEAKNNKGDVELTLPPNASGTVDGHTHNGDIVSEFGLVISGDEDKSVSGRIGSGNSRIVLSSSNGDLNIKKGPAFPSVPAAANAPVPPSAPAPPNARHLKAPKVPPPQPVAQ